MKRSSKAALLSGLILPGIGHLFLRKFFRGFALLITALVALSVVIIKAYERALLIADQIVSGEVPMETGAIAQAVTDSANTADNLAGNIAVFVLAVCWLAGVIDSYRVGAELEKREAQ